MNNSNSNNNTNNNTNNNDWLQKLYLEQLAFLRKKTNEELVQRFNKEVGCRGWTSARSAFLSALRDAFEERDLELDETVFGKGTTSYKHKIQLVGKKVIPINHDEIEFIFNDENNKVEIVEEPDATKIKLGNNIVFWIRKN